jgi:hypothetical protein
LEKLSVHVRNIMKNQLKQDLFSINKKSFFLIVMFVFSMCMQAMPRTSYAQSMTMCFKDDRDAREHQIIRLYFGQCSTPRNIAEHPSGEGIRVDIQFGLKSIDIWSSDNVHPFRSSRRLDKVGNLADTWMYISMLNGSVKETKIISSPSDLPEWYKQFVSNNMAQLEAQAGNLSGFDQLRNYVSANPQIAPQWVAENRRKQEAAAEQRRIEEQRQEQARREQAEAVRLRAERDAAEEQKREQETANTRRQLERMNPGQLFAKADELRSNGQNDLAREALRTLVSKYPNHQLAASAAQQMAGGSSTSASNAQNRLASGSGVQASASKFSSVCIRNSEKIERVLKTAGVIHFAATGDGFWMRALNLYKQVLSPCVGQDSTAQRRLNSVLEGIQMGESFCAQRQSFGCKEWGEGVGSNGKLAAPQNQAWFENFSREAQAAIANPNGYSADLDGQSSSASSPAAAQCEMKLNQLARQAESVSAHPGARSSPTITMQATMYVQKESISVIRTSCPAEPRYQRQAEEFERSFQEIEKTCNQLSTSRCSPRLP